MILFGSVFLLLVTQYFIQLLMAYLIKKLLVRSVFFLLYILGYQWSELTFSMAVDFVHGPEPGLIPITIIHLMFRSFSTLYYENVSKPILIFLDLWNPYQDDLPILGYYLPSSSSV